MKVLNKLAAVALVGVFAVGCGDDNGTGTGGLTMQDLEGVWNASKFEYTDPAGTFPTLDILSVGGAFTITITATSATNGTYTGSLTEPLQAPQAISGTLVLSANGTAITLTDAADDLPDPILFENFTTSGTPPTQATLATNDTEFDWGTGTDVPANLVVVLVKQ